MVKLFSTEHTFAHPFSRVSSAFWRKYPNDQAAHVQAIDCYDRRMVEMTTADREHTQADHSEHIAAPPTLPALHDAVDPSLLPSSSSSSSCASRSSPCLVSNRIISCYTALPTWLNRVGVSNHAYAIETSIVNPATRTMIVKSRNLTGSSLMVMEETCVYTANQHNPQHTDYRQHARITALLPVFAGNFESFTLNSMSKKSKEGLQTIEALCQRLQEEGVETMI